MKKPVKTSTPEKLTFWEWLATVFCHSYYCNGGTKEIHRLNHKQKTCRLHMITKGFYVTRKKAECLITHNNYNGCHTCWSEKDTG